MPGEYAQAAENQSLHGSSQDGAKEATTGVLRAKLQDTWLLCAKLQVSTLNAYGAEWWADLMQANCLCIKKM